MRLFGVHLLGVNAQTGKKLLMSVIVVAAIWVLRRACAWILNRVGSHKRVRFWTRQAADISLTVMMVVALLSIWFENAGRLTTAGGIATAGLAFALQKVITSFAGYLLILRGRIFNVGDRISMGGVRGDVIGLGFLQTRIMEMGQPPDGGDNSPTNWVHSRQYTGRIVIVSNDKVFDEPVYNYTFEFPYIFEELRIPVTYASDFRRAEQILAEAARHHTLDIKQLGEQALRQLERRYFTHRTELGPRVYYRLTDNWIELALRFVADAHHVRELKDRIAREILDGFQQAGIGVASGTYEIVGVPPLRIEELSAVQRDQRGGDGGGAEGEKDDLVADVPTVHDA